MIRRTLHGGNPAGRLAGPRSRRGSQAEQPALRRVAIVVMLFLAASLLGSLSVAPVIAQDEGQAEEQAVAAETTAEEPATTEQPPAEASVAEVEQEAAPAPTGTLEIHLTDANGVGLAGHFVVTDAAGVYHERATEGGIAWFPELNVGTATISQLSGVTDYAFDGATPSYIDVPAGGQAVLPIVNAFLDADGDGVGDSVDVCGAGSDAVDTDGDGGPDACDATPTGDDDADGVDNATDACPTGDDAVDTDADGTADACEETPSGETPEEPSTEAPATPATPDAAETSTVVTEVAPEPVMVEGGAVTCDLLAGLTPTIASDLGEYAPGAVVILTGAGWAPGQVVQIDVQATGGEWSHTAAMTAGHTGGFSYQFTLPESVGVAYRVVATGQCAAPEETSEIEVEVAAEPEVVKDAPVTCTQADAVAPWILTDLADYPPGARVTLTGGSWVGGQTIELLVEDDGVADAERGPWSHTGTVAADAQGAFTYQFDLAPWYVADYSVVATGECKEAKTTFTDSFTQPSATVNGAASTTVGTSASITATMTVNLTSTSDFWRATSWGYNESAPWTCANHADLQGTGIRTSTFSITSPSSSGEYKVTFRAHTTDTCDGDGSTFRTLIGGVVVSTDRRATATINPTTATAGATAVQFTVTLSNTFGPDNLGSARIVIPAGFTAVQIVSITASAGKSWTANTGTVPFISLNATNNGNAPIVNGQSVNVIFTATVPATAGSYLWSTQAWKNHDYSSSTYAINAQPVVIVSGTTACTPTVALSGADLDFGTSTWSGTTYPELTGTLNIQIGSTGSGCSGFPASWTVRATMSDMARTGGGTIPANAISYSLAGSGTAPTGLTRAATTVLGASPQIIATGNATTSTGTWNAGFSLAPPATAPPGSYAGTITITAATASP